MCALRTRLAKSDALCSRLTRDVKPLTMTIADISTLFGKLADDELIQRIVSGELTSEALTIAQAEATARGFDVESYQPEKAAPPRAYEGDLTIVARDLTPTEAHILCACLNAGGVPAETGDTNFVQTLAGAVGGASIRVPANFMSEAREVIAAFRRGDFEINDDFNTDESAP